MTSARPVQYVWDGESEEWRTVPEYPAYQVSSLGRVRRAEIIRGGQGSIRPAGHVLKARPLPLGHLQVTLCMNNTPKTVLVHRLVASAFLPSPVPGQDCVLHGDDDPSNNRPGNLRWGTRQENARDAVKRKRHARGERVSNSKLTEEEVRVIRASRDSNLDLAARYGVSPSAVSMARSGVTWRHVK